MNVAPPRHGVPAAELAWPAPTGGPGLSRRRVPGRPAANGSAAAGHWKNGILIQSLSESRDTTASHGDGPPESRGRRGRPLLAAWPPDLTRHLSAQF